jgi:hypothetical protein
MVPAFLFCKRDVLVLCFLTQMQQYSSDTVFRQEETSPHFNVAFWIQPTALFPWRWIGPEGLVTSLFVGSHRHHRTSCHFSWGYMKKEIVFPVSAAMFVIVSFTKYSLYKVCDEVVCSPYICHVTHCALIKCL